MINFCFSAFNTHFEIIIGSEPHDWLNFANVSRVVRFLYESCVLLTEKAENDLVVMTAGQFRTEDVVTT